MKGSSTRSFPILLATIAALALVSGCGKDTTVKYGCPEYPHDSEDWEYGKPEYLHGNLIGFESYCCNYNLDLATNAWVSTPFLECCVDEECAGSDNKCVSGYCTEGYDPSDAGGGADLHGGDGHSKPDGGTPLDDRYQIILLHDTALPFPMQVEGHLPVKALVIDHQYNQPAKNYPVIYTILASDPECSDPNQCGHFLAKEGFTNNIGEVAMTFEAGTTGDVLYEVELNGQDAIPDAMEILVKPPPIGTLVIQLAYEGPITITDINVRVMHGFKSCQNFNPTQPWTADLDYQKTVGGLASTPKAEGLLVSQSYLVFATAKTAGGGHLAAAGCADAVHILPIEEGETKMTLKLYVLTLNPAGTYDTINHFDFTDAIPGQAGDIINLVVDLFYDPGKIIIDLIKELISQYVGEWITDLAFSLFEDMLADLVTDWLINNSPGFIQDFFVIGQDLVQIVKNVELTSQLKLSKLTNDYYFQGIQNWLGINLYWKLGCPKEDEAGYDPECGKNPFSLQDLSNSDIPIDLITGQFTGMIANFDNLIIDSHKIDLNYGKLILFVINEMILPAISSYNSLTDLLYSIIDCQAIADGFVGDVLEALGIDKSSVENACTSVVGLIVSPIESMIMGLAIDSKLRIHGKCIMVDENDDLMVDKLVEGYWWGHVEIGSDEGSEFEGDFTAVKADYPGQ